MNKVQVVHFDDKTGAVYIHREFDASIDLQDAFMKLAEDITEKEDELHEPDTSE